MLTTPDMLIIGQPDATIPSVQDEVWEVQKYFKGCKVLLGEEANHHTISKHLPQYLWAHVACHVHVDVGEPFNSSFQLSKNSHLTLLELLKAQLPMAELAFLSACHTAAGDVNVNAILWFQKCWNIMGNGRY